MCVRVGQRENLKLELNQTQLCVWIHKAKACLNNSPPTN